MEFRYDNLCESWKVSSSSSLLRIFTNKNVGDVYAFKWNCLSTWNMCTAGRHQRTRRNEFSRSLTLPLGTFTLIENLCPNFCFIFVMGIRTYSHCSLFIYSVFAKSSTSLLCIGSTKHFFFTFTVTVFLRFSCEVMQQSCAHHFRLIFFFSHYVFLYKNPPKGYLICFFFFLSQNCKSIFWTFALDFSVKRAYCCVMLIKKLVNIRIHFPFGHYKIPY